MPKGYTKPEAEALINQVFEPRTFLTGVPRRTRGRVIQALDAGDHWNILIEWQLPHLPAQMWYDKSDVQTNMKRVEP